MHPCFRVVPSVFVLVLTVLFTAVAGDAGPSDRIFFVPIDLGTLGGANVSFSTPAAVNVSGQVVGLSLMPQDRFRAFSWTPAGGMINLGTLGGTYSDAMAVNDMGQVVGESFTPGDVEAHAFSWTQAEGMIDLGTLGGWFSQAVAVNDVGQVVGTSFPTDSNLEFHAFSWTRAGGMVDLGPSVV